jgi:hypothetical protein
VNFRRSRIPFSEAGLPMSDQIYGAFWMTPPELLHTSGAGLILYMFRVIADKLGGGMIRNDLDAQHVRMMTTRNGIVDGTKCQASERRGNLSHLHALHTLPMD